MVEPEGTDLPDERARAALDALREGTTGRLAGADPAADELAGPGPHGWPEVLHAQLARRWPFLADRPGLGLGLIAVVAALLLGTAAWWVTGSGTGSSGPAPTLAFTSTTTVGEGPGAASTAAPPPTALVVHAAGAVHQSGVHRVPSGARVADLLEAAGGAAPDADLDRLNLAAPLTDGARLYVPRVGEDDPPTVVGPVSGDPGGAGGGGGGEGPAAGVDVNRASATELEVLPGVGPATAEAIVAHREANGPFRTVDDLLEVRGIGPSKLEGMRDQVVLG